jgi:flagellar assembly factor FliW
MMRIESQQLGTLEIPAESTVEFLHGIPGFPRANSFCLIEVRPGSRFKLLQCTHIADLAFVVTDPLLVAPDYPLPVVQELASHHGLEIDEPLAVAAIVTVPPPPARPTANLLAPLAMGMRTRRGVQVVLHDSPYQVRHAL